MKRGLIGSLAMLAAVASVSVASACPNGCGAKKAKVTADKGGCPIGAKVDAILASLPSMRFQIGDKTIECSMTAKAASDSGKTVKYLVGKDVFGTTEEAEAKLATLVSNEIENLQTVQYAFGSGCSKCPVTAKKMAAKAGTKVAYRVGGFDFADKAQADKAAEAAKEAAAKVKISYKVGDKSFCCNKMAGDACKKSGKKVAYVVGKDTTSCHAMANRMLTKARVAAIVGATASFVSPAL